jgi:FixJ family two-component response regulator
VNGGRGRTEYETRIAVDLHGTIMANRKPVLVVDDDLSTLKGLGRLLAQYGYEPLLFESADAFEAYEEFEQAVCVVLDINLNGSSGIELRRRLGERGVALPVIYITANCSDATRAEAMSSGCAAYLTKPFGGQALISQIEICERAG